jgi:hypothetical protein
MTDDIGPSTQQFVLDTLAVEPVAPANNIFSTQEMADTGLRIDLAGQAAKPTTQEIDPEKVVREVQRARAIAEVQAEHVTFVCRPPLAGKPSTINTEPHMEVVVDPNVSPEEPTKHKVSPSTIQKLAEWQQKIQSETKRLKEGNPSLSDEEKEQLRRAVANFPSSRLPSNSNVSVPKWALVVIGLLVLLLILAGFTIGLLI